MLALLGQRHVVDDGHGVCATHQAIGRRVQHLLERLGSPRRAGHEVMQLLGLARADTRGHRLDALARPWPKQPLQVQRCPAALLGAPEGGQKRLEPRNKVGLPVVRNDGLAAHGRTFSLEA